MTTSRQEKEALRLAQLQQQAFLDALAAGDRKLAQLAAHSLKGTSAQVCASGIRVLAEEIEHAIREGKPIVDLDPHMAELSAAMQLLVQEISACL